MIVGMTPSGSSVLRNVAARTIFSAVAMRDLLVAAGSLAGAKIPHHAVVSNPLYPDSDTVGTFGTMGERSLLLTASVRNLPPWILENTDCKGSNMIWSWPPTTS